MSGSIQTGALGTVMPGRAPSDGRIEWLDCVKGVAIFLVVFAHVVGGANYRNWFSERQFWLNLYDFIYLFHMPLFFFISGVLGVETMRERPRHDVMSGLRGLVWPLLLWGSAGLAVEPLLHRFTSRASGAAVAIGSDIGGLFTGQVLWFLWTLFVIKLLLLPFIRLPLIWVLAGSLAGYVWHAWSEPFGFLGPVVRYLPFFLVGAMLSGRLRALRLVASPRQAGFLLAAAVGMFALLSLGLLMLNEWPALRGLIGGMLGSAAVICLVLAIRNRIWLWILVRLGAASLAIYVLHPYFQGAAREVLVRWLPLPPLLMVAVTTFAAVAGPLMVWELSQRYGMVWLFRLPKPQPPRVVTDPSAGSTAERR